MTKNPRDDERHNSELNQRACRGDEQVSSHPQTTDRHDGEGGSAENDQCDTGAQWITHPVLLFLGEKSGHCLECRGDALIGGRGCRAVACGLKLRQRRAAGQCGGDLLCVGGVHEHRSSSGVGQGALGAVDLGHRAVGGGACQCSVVPLARTATA